MLAVRDPTTNATRVADPSAPTGAGASAGGANPTGKQLLGAQSSTSTAGTAGWFGPVSGIHAPIWLEGVPTVFLDSLHIEALPSTTASVAPPSGTLAFTATLRDSYATARGATHSAHTTGNDPYGDYILVARVFEARLHHNTTELDFLDPRAENATVVATLSTRFESGGSFGNASLGIASAALSLEIPPASLKLWSPDAAWLHGVEVDLIDNRTGGMVLRETVTSYAGVRSLAVINSTATSSGARIALNGEPLAIIGVRDQGYWPDGLTTAPSDSAIAADVLSARALGFNAVRKEEHVAERRYYFHADAAGMMVLQDIPALSMRAAAAARPPAEGRGRRDEGRRAVASVQPTPAMEAQFIAEARAIVAARRMHPSIVAWSVFNEGWGEADGDGGAFATAAVAAVAAADVSRPTAAAAAAAGHAPSRLVIGAVGWDGFGLGQLRALAPEADGPLLPRDRRADSATPDGAKPLLLDNVGGWSWSTAVDNAACVAYDELGAPRVTLANASAFATAYDALVNVLILQALQNTNNKLSLTPLSGFVFDQLFDVETQCSGVMSAARSIKGGDATLAAVRDANALLAKAVRTYSR